REALREGRAQGTRLHTLDERPGDADVHVGFEQRPPDLARDLVDIAFRQPSPIADAGEDAFETIGEGVEQGESGYSGSSAAKIAAVNSRGSKSTRSSTPSPTPTTFTGRPSSDWIASTMPPLAVPSSFVSTMPVTSTASANCFACTKPFCPVDASITSNTSLHAPSVRS